MSSLKLSSSSLVFRARPMIGAGSFRLSAIGFLFRWQRGSKVKKGKIDFSK
jgi:hypothetical protein